jgi:hypothetical protein
MADPTPLPALRGPHPFGLLSGGLTFLGSLIAIAVCFQRVNFDHLGWQGAFDRFGLKLCGVPLLAGAALWLLVSAGEFFTKRGTNLKGGVLTALGVAVWAAVLLTTTGR